MRDIWLRIRDEVWHHLLWNYDFFDAMKKLQVHTVTMWQGYLTLYLDYRLPTKGIPSKICRFTTRWRNERHA
jgi:hypothetical protein